MQKKKTTLKRILIGFLILIVAYAGITYYFWRENKRKNIERMIAPQKALPKVLYAKAECANFKRKLLRSEVDIIVSNPSTLKYSSIYISVVGVGKEENTVKVEDIVFDNVQPNTVYKKTVYLPHSAWSAECVLTKFE